MSYPFQMARDRYTTTPC